MTTVREFLEKSAVLNNAWVIASLTDQYIVDRWTEHSSQMLEANADNVLEIRIFNSECEYKLIRSDIGKTFTERVIDDRMEQRDHFDELQYLDIDRSRPLDAEGRVSTTGGGKFKLPIETKGRAKIRVRYYLGQYPETGQARIEDWRVTEFIGE